MFRPYIVILGVYCQVTISSWHSPQEEEEEEKEEGRKEKKSEIVVRSLWGDVLRCLVKQQQHQQQNTSTCTHKREHVDCTTSYIHMYTQKRARGLYNELHPHVHT